jgi:hypothetical protein
MMESTMEVPGDDEIEVFKRKKEALVITDDVTMSQVLTLIADCKASEDRNEAKREKEVAPHLAEQRRINGFYKPIIEFWKAARLELDTRVSDYRKRKQQEIEEANRRAIAAADAERKAREAKAEAARQEAERLRLEVERIEQERIQREFDEEMARLEAENKRKAEEKALRDAQEAGDKAKVEAARLELERQKAEETARLRQVEEDRTASALEALQFIKAALKQESKADIEDSRAMMAAPVLQASAPKTAVLDDGTKATGKKVWEWSFKNGLPIKGEDYYRDDPRMKDIPDRFFVLDLTKLGKVVRDGEPIPGTKRDYRFATSSKAVKE